MVLSRSVGGGGVLDVVIEFFFFGINDVFECLAVGIFHGGRTRLEEHDEIIR